MNTDIHIIFYTLYNYRFHVISLSKITQNVRDGPIFIKLHDRRIFVMKSFN